MQSIIKLCKGINVDKEYNNVLNYTESQMLSLCDSKKIAESNDYSFIRVNKNSILVNFTYSQCLQANYIAFQNKDYSNKWFFAWIDDVNYKNDGATEITYTIDAWSTWFSYWDAKKCFVIREHVSSDGYGEHTIPEGLETGEYVSQFSSKFGSFGASHVVMGTTISPRDGETQLGGGEYGGIYSGIKYFIFRNYTDLSNALYEIASHGNSNEIVSLFYCPDWITGYSTATFDSKGIAEVPNSYTATRGGGIAIPLHPTQIGSYTPKHKKIFSYPYTSYVISNNAGTNVELHLEDFYDDGTHIASTDIYGSCCPGASIRLIPKNYKIANTEYNETHANEYGINMGKYPIASYPNDVYKNWLSQSGLNVGLGTVGSILTLAGATATAVATGGLTVPLAVGVLGGAVGVGNSLSQFYTHSFNPVHAEGNTNSGDVSFSADYITFTGYLMTVKEEYARVLDAYWDRYGYKVNSLKVPNITGKPYWNYIQIGTGEDIGTGDVPGKYMDIINQTARKGTTIWHNHDNIGNFNLNN